LGGRGVDRGDAGVGERAAQDRPVQHAGELDVVEVAAPAPQEPGVLLAQHPAEADGVAGGAAGGGGAGLGVRPGGVGLGGGHADTSVSLRPSPGAAGADCVTASSSTSAAPWGCSAAQRTAATMFW